MYTYTHCPVCQSQNFSSVLEAKDTTVSGQMFQISHCAECTHRFTNPVPEAGEIGPYYKSETYISHSNTSKGLINRLYQIVRRMTLKGKKNLVQKSVGKRAGNILDIGSGAGAFLSTMQSAGWKVEGLEPDEDARAVARKDFGVEARPIEDFFALNAGQYDAITLWHVLEHVHELDRYMVQMKQLLKPEGRLLIAVPNYDSFDADKYQERWAAYDVPRHLYHFTAASMTRLLERHGFTLERIRWMPFDSFYVSMLSERNYQGSLVRGIWNGFCSYLTAMFRTRRCSSIIYVVKK